MKTTKLLFALILMVIATSVIFVAGQEEETEAVPPVQIAAASNLNAVLPALVETYTAENETFQAKLVFASSRKLYAQITSGALFDLYLAAHDSYPARLADEGFAAGEPEVYSRGVLACVSTIDGFPADGTIDDLVA